MDPQTSKIRVPRFSVVRGGLQPRMARWCCLGRMPGIGFSCTPAPALPPNLPGIRENHPTGPCPNNVHFGLKVVPISVL